MSEGVKGVKGWRGGGLGCVYLGVTVTRRVGGLNMCAERTRGAAAAAAVAVAAVATQGRGRHRPAQPQ